MNQAMYIAFGGLKSRAEAVDVAANNLANLGVAGYKKDRVYYNIVNRVAPETRDELERVLGDVLVAERTMVDFSVGNLSETGNPLDLALAEEGFFVIETPRGPRYTRNGSFMVNGSGELVTSQGYPVLGETGKIKLAQGDIQVSKDGGISVSEIPTGRLKIVHFEDLSQLAKEGASLFRADPDAKQFPPTSLTVHQGYLEQANLNPVRAVADMISLMRSFEMIGLAIRSLSNQVDKKVTEEVGRV